MQCVAFHKLYGLESHPIDVLYFVSYHVDHVLMRQVRAGKMETDGQWMFLWWLAELDNSSLNLTFDDAERLESVDYWHDVVSWLRTAKCYCNCSQHDDDDDGDEV